MAPIQRYSRTVTVCLENGVSQMHSVFLTGNRDWSGGGWGRTRQPAAGKAENFLKKFCKSVDAWVSGHYHYINLLKQ